MKPHVLTTILFTALLGCDGPGATGDAGAPPVLHCDTVMLQSALAAAQSGDVVRVGSCTIEGTFRVPSGVTLAGEGPSASVLRASEPGLAVVRLDPSDPPSRLEGVFIESGAAIGVYAAGPGAIEITSVEVSAREGVGALFSDVDSVTLDGVTLNGPIPIPSGEDHTDAAFLSVSHVAPETVTMLTDLECGTVAPRACVSGERRETACPGCGTVRQYCDGCGEWVSLLATQGIAFVGVGEAFLTNVDVGGFAKFGVVAQGTGSSRLSWVGGNISDNMGTGLFVDGVYVILENVRIDRTYAGFRSSPAVAGFVVGGAAPATLVTRGLCVSESRGYGLIHLGGTAGITADHDGLEATANAQAAIWVAESDSFQLSNAIVMDNQLAGVVVVNSSGVAIRDTMVAGTRMRTTQVGGSADGRASVTLGDGIQFFGSMSQVDVQGVTLSGNERVGLSLDLGAGGTADADLCGAGRTGVCFTAVMVSGTGTERGAIAGNMPLETEPDVFTVQPVGSGRWDEGITREGSAIDDATFADPLQVTGAVAPLDYPIAGAVAPLD